tara:strand:- start:327 stop:803 length:477 start_codon:yes stop_codon:yes gene_type:complete
MQDCAKEITALLEPSEPLGYRLLTFASWQGDLVFEAKAVAYKGKIGFLVRGKMEKKYGNRVSLDELLTSFAPTEDALIFLFRHVYNLFSIDACVILKPPHSVGIECTCRDDSINVELPPRYHLLNGDHDSVAERTLRETVAALTLMQVPDELKRLHGY